MLHRTARIGLTFLFAGGALAASIPTALASETQKLTQGPALMLVQGSKCMTERADNNVMLEDCDESNDRQYWSSVPADADGLTGRALINLATDHKMSVVRDNVVAGLGGIRETIWDHISAPGGYHFKNASLGSFIGAEGENVKMQQQPLTWSAR